MTTATTREPQPLTERELAILDFERHWWKFPGAKDQEIRDRFDMTPTRYYQTLNVLMDKPAALHVHPMLIKRLHRIRAARSGGRRRTATT